jgi:cell division protein FtsL
MTEKRVLLYVIVFSITLSLGLLVWQGVRCATLKKDVKRLEAVQNEWVLKNKRLITDIAALSSSARIEKIAKDSLGLDKKQPEDILQVRIDKNVDEF